MTLRERVSLRELTTLRAGGSARLVAVCESVDDVQSALRVAQERNLPVYVLGDGSNVLADDGGYDGLLLMPRIEGVEVSEQEAVVGAGVSWDVFVRETAEQGLWGVENLAGIPGTVGAAPVQNIGAYGAEAADTISFVEAVARDTGALIRLSPTECEFGYRDSRFKRTQDFIITRVGFSLSYTGSPRLSYSDLTRAQEAGQDLTTPLAIGEVVRTIRARKFPDLTQYGTAGSFFKNPVVSTGEYQALAARFPGLPQFPAEEGVKIPLAFLLDRALALKGFRMGHAWLYDAQPLVLVLDDGGTAREVDALARYVAERVKEETGITIEREVRTLPEK